MHVKWKPKLSMFDKLNPTNTALLLQKPIQNY